MKNNRDHYIRARVTKEEHEHITIKARSTGVPIAVYLRSLAMNYPLKSIADQLALSELIKSRADLGRVGGLLKMWLVDNKDKNIHLGMRSYKEVDLLVDDIEDKQKELLELSKKLLGA